MNTNVRAVIVVGLAFSFGGASAHAGDFGLTGDRKIPNIEISGNVNGTHNHDGKKTRADGHAPIGVMGDHMHKKGEFMVSYRYMNMLMEGNRSGTDNLSNSDILAIANPFAGQAGQPAGLRVIPTDMRMHMHMVGGMYAPTDWLTLMTMWSWTKKDMNHVTFNGAGTTELGNFNVTTSGVGDPSFGGLIKLWEKENHHLHANVAFTTPLGSTKKQHKILAPNGTTPTLRTPYAMQIGTGTYNFLPGITYTGHADKYGWGTQYSGKIHSGENSQGYAFGDVHKLSLWGSYQWADWVSTSLRVTGRTEGEIRGSDSAIAVPNQTADPDNYGGERVDLSLGVNFAGQPGSATAGSRLGVELTMPVYQDLNGPQMETDYILSVGYQYAF